MSRGPSPVYPQTPATPEFIAWFRKTLAHMIPMTADIVSRGEQHMPGIFVWPNDDQVTPAIIPVPHFFHDIDGKDAVAMLHREIANDEIVYAAIMINEAWVKMSITKEEIEEAKRDLKKVMSRSLEDDPKRQEAIVYNAQSKGMQLIATYLIERPGNTLKTPCAILVDAAAGVIEVDGQPPGDNMKEGLSTSHGRMVVPPKPDA